MGNDTVHSLNELLLDQRHMTDLKQVNGLAKRAIAGLQVLSERAEIRLETELFGKIGSSVPGQFASHGTSLRIRGESGIGSWGDRKVSFSGILPVYRTSGGAPAFREYDGGDTPLDLTFTVTSSSGEASTFTVTHGSTAWVECDEQDEYDVEHGLEYELPEPVAELVRDLVQRMCERVLVDTLGAAQQVRGTSEGQVYTTGHNLRNLALVRPMLEAGVV